MAEVEKIIERLRRGDRHGTEDLIAAMTLMQGQLDTNSFIAGLLLGKGRGLDNKLPLLLALGASANAQQQSSGMGTTNPLQQLLPLLLLLDRDDCSEDRTFEVIEKRAQEVS